jgi:hypothetical protein
MWITGGWAGWGAALAAPHTGLLFAALPELLHSLCWVEAARSATRARALVWIGYGLVPMALTVAAPLYQVSDGMVRAVYDSAAATSPSAQESPEIRAARIAAESAASQVAAHQSDWTLRTRQQAQLRTLQDRAHAAQDRLAALLAAQAERERGSALDWRRIAVVAAQAALLILAAATVAVGASIAGREWGRGGHPRSGAGSAPEPGTRADASRPQGEHQLSDPSHEIADQTPRKLDWDGDRFAQQTGTQPEPTADDIAADLHHRLVSRWVGANNTLRTGDAAAWLSQHGGEPVSARDVSLLFNHSRLARKRAGELETGGKSETRVLGLQALQRLRRVFGQAEAAEASRA